MRGYFWFRGESVATLLQELTAAGPEARVEFRVSKGSKHATITVVPPGVVTAAGGGGGPINDSHLCPPSCP